MPPLSPLVAYDLLRFAPGHLGRLADADAELRELPGLDAEKAWLRAAVEALRRPVERVAAVLASARMLPELEEVRPEFLAELQERWVDAAERLVAGITFHVGGRAPILEALFPNQKFSALRKATPEVASQWANEFERRLKSGYVTRMGAQPEFAFMPAVVEQVSKAQQEWRALWTGSPPPEVDLAASRAALLELGSQLEARIQQTRLVAEAALWPLEQGFERSGLNAKPRRRAVVTGPAPEAMAESAQDVRAPEVPVDSVQAPPPLTEPALEEAPALLDLSEVPTLVQPLPENAEPSPKPRGRTKTPRERR